MTDSRRGAGNIQWGWRCPRCDTDVGVARNPQTGTFSWECEEPDCVVVGFGFRSRRRARLGVLEYRERYRSVYR